MLYTGTVLARSRTHSPWSHSGINLAAWNCFIDVLCVLRDALIRGTTAGKNVSVVHLWDIKYAFKHDALHTYMVDITSLYSWNMHNILVGFVNAASVPVLILKTYIFLFNTADVKLYTRVSCIANMWKSWHDIVWYISHLFKWASCSLRRCFSCMAALNLSFIHCCLLMKVQRYTPLGLKHH